MASSRPPQSRRAALTYAGIFLVALATLMLEVLLTRITSVIAWYHLAFFVISLGMLGMTAGAVAVFLLPGWFEASAVPQRLAQSALGFALAIPLCVAIALALPLIPATDLMAFLALLATGCVLALPFVLGGVTLTLALTRAGLPPSTAYGVDLLGAALGCALVIPLLNVLDAPSAALIAAALAALSACAFALAAGRRARFALVTALALIGLGYANGSAVHPPLHPAWVKGEREDLARFVFARWNTYSRVTVEPTVIGPPGFWAHGRNLPPGAFPPLEQRVIKIDGAAGTAMSRMGKSPREHGYLAWEITAVAHELRSEGPAAVIGVGGGRDVLAAARVGHRPVVGIELNRLIVDLHEREMAEFSGITKADGVRLVNDEARSFLARDEQQYSVIAMPMIDTWASTGAGAYSLSENGLYTVEAWSTFLKRLLPGGVFSVSRWYFVDSPAETARMLALAMETAWHNGARNPRNHIMALQSDLVATLLLSRTPFTAADIDRVQQIATEKGYNTLATPRKLPVHPLLRDVMRAPSQEGFAGWAELQPLDYTAPTDARPFFFQMLRPMIWLTQPETHKLDLSFLGNMAATQTLLYAVLVSLLLALCALIGPMLSRLDDLRGLPKLDVAAALAYFALIGLGFMFVEIGLLSRLNVFLGHPTLALAVLLGGIICFTGVGSLLSSRIDLSAARWATLYPLLPAALVLVAALCVLPLMRAFEAAATPVRIAVSVALLVPPALGLGLCFPLGLRLCEQMEQARGAAAPRLGPWLWGINGAFGVCASGLALATSMSWGISTTLLIGAGCYLLLPLANMRLWRAARSRPSPAVPGAAGSAADVAGATPP